MKNITSIIFVIALNTGFLSGQELNIEITNVRSEKGSIVLAFYQNDDQFQNDKVVIKKTIKKTNMKEGVISTKIEGLKPGNWGIALLDDENNDKDMNYRFKMPTEGYGFSNYVHSSLRYPKFDDFKFIVLDNKNNKVKIKVSYFL